VASLVWVEDRTRNEALDTAVYARAALKLLARMSGSRTEDRMLGQMAARMKGAQP
jgi:phage terminase large subunit GpA-like protein